MTPITDIAQIQSGYQHRGKEAPISLNTKGTFRIIQPKDVDLEEGHKTTIWQQGHWWPYIWPEQLHRVPDFAKAERYQVQLGDVLFLSRGTRNNAVSIVEPLENTIASYYFYIVRPDPTRVLGEFLAWSINQPQAQTFLEKQQRGSSVKIVPIGMFQNLKIPLPPLETQHMLMKLEHLSQREQFLMQQLAQKRHRLMMGLQQQAVLTHSGT